MISESSDTKLEAFKVIQETVKETLSPSRMAITACLLIFESTDLPSPCKATMVGPPRRLYSGEQALLLEIQPPLAAGTTFGNSRIPDELLKYVVASAKLEGSSILQWLESPGDPFPIYVSSLKDARAIDTEIIEHSAIEATDWASLRM